MRNATYEEYVPPVEKKRPAPVAEVEEVEDTKQTEKFEPHYRNEGGKKNAKNINKGNGD